jgi:hypothetical protein
MQPAISMDWTLVIIALTLLSIAWDVHALKCRPSALVGQNELIA